MTKWHGTQGLPTLLEEARIGTRLRGTKVSIKQRYIVYEYNNGPILIIFQLHPQNATVIYYPVQDCCSPESPDRILGVLSYLSAVLYLRS